MDFHGLLIFACGLFGLVLGSFANVCVHRIPRGESVAFPGSHCPQCAQAIAWYDNIPLFSWLWLKGRCRHCQQSISWRYPLLELLMGLSWALLAWRYGFSPLLLEALVLVSWLWILSLIDLETGLLPNVLTFPGMFIGLLFSWWLGDVLSGVIGLVVGYGFFWLIAKVYLWLTGREGMGYGDFKLLGMLGAFMGWQALPFIVFLSSLTGALIGSVLLLLSGKGMRVEIPFGPYLAAAGMIWFLWGHAIIVWYAGMLH